MNRLTITASAIIPLMLTVGCTAARVNSAVVIEAQRAALSAPGDVDSWCDLGQAYAFSGQYEEAHSVFSGVISRGVDVACAEDGIETLVELGWFVEIERRVLENPENDELWGDLGDHYSEIGDTDAALNAYRHAMLLDPQDGEWHSKISTITGESLEDLIAAGSASILANYEAELPYHQEDDEWLGDYGDLLMSMGREEEACDLYSTALALDPQDYEWVGNVAECNGESIPSGEEHGMGGQSSDESVMDYSSDPTYGEVSLELGFEPDPHIMDVVAGGDTRVSIAGCQGYVLTSAPDSRLHYSKYEGAENFPLSFYVTSMEDTVLFVNMPDGEWVCNDDTSGTDPAITIDEPMEGQYDIWVGTYNANSNSGASLMISEFSEISWEVDLSK